VRVLQGAAETIPVKQGKSRLVWRAVNTGLNQLTGAYMFKKGSYMNVAWLLVITRKQMLAGKLGSPH
jgi:hypothetical protein